MRYAVPGPGLHSPGQEDVVKKRTLPGFMRIIPVASLLAALVVGLSGCKAPSPSGLPDGHVVLLKGDVTRNGSALSLHDRILNGDRLHTGGDSAVEVVFGDGLIVRFGSGSEVLVDAGALRLNRGWIAAVKNADARSVDVITPTATASVRGTSLCLKVESETSTYACACNGTVHFHTKDGKELPLTSAHHAARTFGADGTVAESTLKYHDDSTMEELAPKIKHPLDWSRP